MLTQRACTRAISRYAPEVLAGMSAAGVWPEEDETPAAAEPVTIPAPEREPEIDADQLEEILDRVHKLPPEQFDWFGHRWKDDLGCPNLHRARWLRRSHGALALYMLAEAEKAAAFAERLDEAIADAVPPETHDDDTTPEAFERSPKYDPDDAA
jgi:hypothetical protein